MNKMRTLKDIAKKFNSEHLLKDDTYELGLVKKEGIKWVKELQKRIKELHNEIDNNSISFAEVSGIMTKRIKYENQIDWITYFFNIEKDKEATKYKEE